MIASLKGYGTRFEVCTVPVVQSISTFKPEGQELGSTNFKAFRPRSIHLQATDFAVVALSTPRLDINLGSSRTGSTAARELLARIGFHAHDSILDFVHEPNVRIDKEASNNGVDNDIRND